LTLARGADAESLFVSLRLFASSSLARLGQIAINRVEKALQYQYRDRKVKKREARKLWIQQINAATRQHGIIYSQFMHTLAKDNIKLDRKTLSDLAINEPHSFKALVDRVKFMRGNGID